MSNVISLKEKTSYGIGAIGKDMAFWIMCAYLMMFFTDVVELSPAYLAFLFLFARIWDAVNDPIMGLIVDNTKSKYGKFRPWIFIGTVLNSIAVLFLFTDPSGFLTPTGVAIWCGVSYILWGMTYTIMDIPYWSMIPAFSTDSKVRDIMSVIPRTCAMIGGQIVIIFGLPIITFLGVSQGETQADGFFRFAILVVACFMICTLICTANVREHVQTPLRKKISVKDMLKLLGKNDQLVVIIVLTIIQQICQNLVNGTILYYFKYAICHEDLYPYFMAVGAICQFAAFIAFPKLVEKTSRKFVYVLSTLAIIIGYLSMFFFGSQADSNVFVAAGCFGIASIGVAFSCVCTTVMLADTVDYGEFKLGTRSESIVFSMQTMTVKFGAALAGFMSSMTLAIVGYIPNVPQTPETLLGLRIVMFVVSAILMAIVLVLYLKYYKLNGSFYLNMLSALEVSRDKARKQKEISHLIRHAVSEDQVQLNLKAESKEDVINKLVDKLSVNEAIDSLEDFRKAVFEREALASTGISDGIAIPHAKSWAVTKPLVVIATLEKAIDFGAPDGKDCDLVCLIASPDDGNLHLDVIGRLSLILNDKDMQAKIRNATSASHLVELISNAEKALG